MPSMRALLLLLTPVSVLLAVASRSLARVGTHFAWPMGSSFRYLSMQRKHAQKVAPEQRDHELRVSPYRRSGGESEEQAVECVFCLSGVEEGDEIRELRCRHLFHRACLDRWLARPPATCPLCRCRLLATSPPAAPWEEEDVDGEEEDSDMVLFMAYVHRSSSWFWSPYDRFASEHVDLHKFFVYIFSPS